MTPDNLRELSFKLAEHKILKNITYAEFCKEAGINQSELVNFQTGKYLSVCKESIEKIRVVVCG